MGICIGGLFMKYKEFGCGNSKTIIFLHGGGLSWWNYREEAEMLKNEYHIIFQEMKLKKQLILHLVY